MSADTNPMVERHADGTALVRVDGAELRFTGTSETPRVRDLDLAGWLGFERPRNIRNLISRMEREGKLKHLEVCFTAKQTRGGRPGREYWLTREQSLLVATQSDTPRAWALTEVMVKVFDAVLDRRPVAPAPTDPAMALAVARALSLVPQLVEQVQTLSADVGSLRAEMSTGVIGEAVAQAKILRPLGQIATLSATGTKSIRSTRRRVDNRLRGVLGHVGPGSTWSMLPRRLLDVAQRTLALWLREAIAAACDAAQPPLPGLRGKP